MLAVRYYKRQVARWTTIAFICTSLVGVTIGIFSYLYIQQLKRHVFVMEQMNFCLYTATDLAQGALAAQQWANAKIMDDIAPSLGKKRKRRG